MLGVGLLLIWRSGSRAPSRTHRAGPSWVTKREELLRQAGVTAVGSTQLFAAQLLCAIVSGTVLLALTQTVTIAMCFAVFAFFVPLVVLRRMRRRRLVVLREL